MGYSSFSLAAVGSQGKRNFHFLGDSLAYLPFILVKGKTLKLHIFVANHNWVNVCCAYPKSFGDSDVTALQGAAQLGELPDLEPADAQRPYMGEQRHDQASFTSYKLCALGVGSYLSVPVPT